MIDKSERFYLVSESQLIELIAQHECYSRDSECRYAFEHEGYWRAQKDCCKIEIPTRDRLELGLLDMVHGDIDKRKFIASQIRSLLDELWPKGDAVEI